MDPIEQVKNWALNSFFKKRDFTDSSRGTQDAFRPLVLNSYGRLALSAFDDETKLSVASGDTLIVYGDYQYSVADIFTIIGIVDIIGELVIF